MSGYKTLFRREIKKKMDFLSDVVTKYFHYRIIGKTREENLTLKVILDALELDFEKKIDYLENLRIKLKYIPETLFQNDRKRLTKVKEKLTRAQTINENNYIFKEFENLIKSKEEINSEDLENFEIFLRYEGFEEYLDQIEIRFLHRWLNKNLFIRRIIRGR